MTKKSFRIVIIIIIVALAAVSIGLSIFFTLSEYEPVEYDKGDGISEKIESYGIASGDIVYLYDDSDAFGNDQIVYGDDLYTYTFDESSHLVAISLKPELYDNYNDQPMHGTEYYEEIAKTYEEKCLPFFDSDSTEYITSLNQYYVDVKIRDYREGCLINSGSVMLSGNGTLMHLSGTSNTIEMFEDKASLSESDACEIVFNDLKRFNEHIDTIDDIAFSDIEKQKSGDQIFWCINAVVPATQYEYSYIINADTGEIVEAVTLPTD